MRDSFSVVDAELRCPHLPGIDSEKYSFASMHRMHRMHRVPFLANLLRAYTDRKATTLKKDIAFSSPSITIVNFL